MLDDIKEANGIEGSVAEGQVEDRSLNEFGTAPRVFGTDYDAVKADVVSKALAHDKRSEPTRRATNVQEAIAGFNKVGALFYTTLKAHLGANSEWIRVGPLYLHVQPRFSLMKLADVHIS
jgi:hypothetical protein